MKRISLLIYFLAAACVTLSAREVITIVKPGAAQTGLDFSGFNAAGPAASTFADALRKNMLLSSLVNEVPPSRSDFRVTGEAAASGENLQVQVEVINRAGQSRTFGRKYSAKVGQETQVARMVSDDVMEALTGRPGFASKRLVFVGEKNGTRGKDLYSMYPDGGGMIRLTPDQSVVVGPSWSPDGESLVYTSFHRGFPDIYQHVLRTAQRKVLSSSSGMNSGGALSPDQRHLAMILSRDGKPELYVKDLSSGRLTRLTRTPMSAKSSPSWSPDGSQIVFTSGHQGSPQLYLISRKGGNLTRITRGGGENVSADWGTNGLITFTRRRGGLYQVAVIDPQTQDLRFVSPPTADYEDPSWAPDGVHIVASRTVRGRSSLSLLDIAGKADKTLLQGQGDWYMPDWSP
jgi:TolB protein